MNNRTNIRSALVTMLSGNTDAGTNVYPHRATNLWDSQLPAILIFTNQESAQPESLRSTRSIRTLELSIEVRIKASTDVDSAIDALMGDIEDILTADRSLVGTVISSQLTNSEIRVDGSTDTEIGVGVLTFECKYIS